MQKIKTFLIIWIIILLVNQLAIFGACFTFKCILNAIPHTVAISIVIFYAFFDKQKNRKTKPKYQHENKKPTQKVKPKNNYKQDTRPKSINQKKGDAYEKFIGKKFEEKNHIVIYNGFIKGYEDKGIDIIVLSKEQKVINLVQCKNWTRKPMTLDDIKNIYHKLDVHYDNLDLYYLSTSEIYKHTQQANLNFLEFDDTLHDLRSNIDTYTIRKTLYVASENVIDLEIGKHLTMMQKNIYRYLEMKIVIEGM